MLHFLSPFPHLSSEAAGICEFKVELAIPIRLSRTRTLERWSQGDLCLCRIYLELRYGVQGRPGTALAPSQGRGTYQHVNGTAHAVFLALVMHDNGSVVQEIL